MEYIIHIVILINIYIMLVLSANLTAGLTNLLTMCQAAFYGLGAYLGTFLLMRLDVPLVLILLAVSLFNGCISLVVSLASVKLKGDYFVLASMGFQLIIYTVLYNWVTVTHGPLGISGIPGIKLFGVREISGVYEYLVLTVILVFAFILLFRILHNSPFGRVLKAVKADETVVRAKGHDTVGAKSWAFFISAAAAGVAGAIYASYMGYIDPTSFTLNESIFIICALFIGGIGNVKGPALGAVFVVLLPEILRFIGLPIAVAANLKQIIYGLSLILIVFFRPQGLLGKTVLK